MKAMKALTVLLTASLLMGSSLALQAGQDHRHKDHAGQDHNHKGHAGKDKHAADGKDKAVAEIIHHQLPSYPFTACMVSGEEFGDELEPRNVVANGRLLRVCCKRCEKKVRSAPDEWIAKVNAAVIEAQAPGYPLTACPISGQGLESMGKPVDFVHGTRLVRFCCERCVRAFKMEPKKTMESLNAALIKKQVASYPLDTCLVSDEELGGMGEPIDHLYGTQLVRLCCKGCIKGFKKSPAKYVAKLTAARKDT